MSEKNELRDRVQARRHELQSRLLELRADGREEVRKRIQRIETELAEVEDMVKDGWDNLTDKVANKLNSWLKPEA